MKERHLEHPRPRPAVLPARLGRWPAALGAATPSGSPAFNEELGRLTLFSYPMIALPSMLIMMAALYFLARSLRELAGLKLTEALKGHA